MRFVDVLLGENEAIAGDSMRHFRSGILHVLDPRYESLASFGAGSWPTYVLASATGEVVAHRVSLGREPGASAAWRAALERVSADGAAPKTAGFETVCENGICRLVPPDGVEPPVRESAPAAVAGGDGSIWVAWVSDVEGDGNVYLRRWIDGEPGAAVPVTTSLADDYAPALAAAPDGRIWVAWTSNRAPRYDIWLRAYDGARWSPEIRVTASADDAMAPSVAVDGAGRVWVTYYEWNRDFGTSRDRDVFARWFRGEEASPPLRISPPEPAIEDHTDPAVIADPARADRVWIAWSWDYHPSLHGEDLLDTDQPSIFAAPVDADGTVGAPLLVGTPGVAHHAVDLWPSLAFDPEGTLWCAFDSAPLARRVRRAVLLSSLGDGAFTMPDRVFSTSVPFSSPTLAIDATGARLLAWTERREGAWQIRITRNAGRGWSDPLPVSPAPRDQTSPALVTTPAGSWIVFEEHDGPASHIRLAPLPRPADR